MGVLDELKVNTYPCPPKDSATRTREIAAAYFRGAVSKADAPEGVGAERAVETPLDAGDSPSRKTARHSLGHVATEPTVARGPSAPQEGPNFIKIVL